jgi:hypothetical protein
LHAAKFINQPANVQKNTIKPSAIALASERAANKNWGELHFYGVETKQING